MLTPSLDFVGQKKRNKNFDPSGNIPDIVFTPKMVEKQKEKKLSVRVCNT